MPPLPRLSLVFAYEEREHNQVEESHDLGAYIDDDVVFGGEDAEVRGVRPCYDHV